MPLVVLCGIPCSGKTLYAESLKEYLATRTEMPVLIINEEFLGVNKAEAYASNFHEKNLRALLKSTVEKELTDNKIVILDSLNYIKGYRFELSCIVKTARTVHCLVLIDIPVVKALEWNQTYPPELLEDLANRMEFPLDKNRWDKPLIVIRTFDQMKFDDVWDALVNRNTQKRAVCNTVEEPIQGDYVYLADKEIQTAIDLVLKAQEDYPIGSSVNLGDCEIHLSNPMSALLLKRKRKDFLKMNSQNPCPVQQIKGAFIEYLNSN